jgi:enterochelin esterase-like enzyme
LIALARARRGPIVEPTDDPAVCDVTFVFADSARSAAAAALLCPAVDGGLAPLQPVGDHVFAGTFPFPAGARVKYRFVPDPDAGAGEAGLLALRESAAAARADTLNAQLDVVSIPELGLRMFESVLSLPGAAPGAPVRRPAGVAAGAVEALSVPSEALRGERPVTLWRPAGLGADRLPVVLLLDGQLDWWRAPVLFDVLRAGGAAPFLGVAVGTRRFTARLRDLGGNPAFVRFVADELLPLLASRHGAAEAGHVAAGFSAGALGAAHLALAEPRRFPRLLAISGGYHLTTRTRTMGPLLPSEGTPWLVEEYERAAGPVPERAYLAAGTYEPAWEQTTRLAEALRARDTDVRLEVGPTDHDTITARAHLLAGLEWLLSPNP